jgi:hypothetical protein
MSLMEEIGIYVCEVMPFCLVRAGDFLNMKRKIRCKLMKSTDTSD